MSRGVQPVRDGVGVAWLLAAVAISLVHRWVPAPGWLMIHLVLLGALTHAALVWSEHFAHTLLRTLPDAAGVRRQTARVGLLAVGALLVLVGVPLSVRGVVLAGALLVGVAVVWHALHLVATLRRALPSRFRVVTAYYVAAAACLPFGAGFGAALAREPGDMWHGRLVVAHVVANVLGWIGLTVAGTLVTFWPTVLRTRMDARAERLARQALPILGAGLVLLVAGALAGLVPLALAGLLVYLAGLGWWGRALHSPVRARGIRDFAPASIAAALAWGTVAVVWLGVLLASGWEGVSAGAPMLGAVLAVGFGAQLLTGALSYLVPSVTGGGATAVAAGQARLNRGATWRLVVINGGLALWLLPAPSWVRVTTSTLVLVALAWFLALLAGAVRDQSRARRRSELEAALDRSGAVRVAVAGSPAGPPAPRPVWTPGGLLAGVAALVLAVTAGVGLDPGAAGLPVPPGVPAAGAPARETWQPTGRTTRVEVTAQGMSFTPNRITVPRGNRLVVVLTNADPTTTHDLVIGGARTPRLRPGETAEVDAGVLGATTRGWCSIAGHRQMGMVLDVVVEGDVAPPPQAGGTTHAAPGHGDGDGGTERAGGGHGGAVPAVAGASLAAASIVDPALPPLPDGRLHRVTLTVTEVALEVAPGLWQTRWTYDGASVGPTLHGRVGDEFEVTLVNDGTIGHSIDFHAGALAPDLPMRTIPPGESLVYRFTAQRAGVWMYHCSTMPMSAHIAAGMHGAVVIEPEGLPPVDRSYVLVQSEVYLAGPAGSAAEASEVDADAVLAERPDRVVFNGVANQYDARPFAARVGERVRFWVLDAGPNRPTSFHIVGGQFDTVWAEGGYLLRDGRDAFGGASGGAQALALQPAQGGFVELVFPEAGHYPVVSHVMVDAERGAHGIVEVGPADQAP